MYKSLIPAPKFVWRPRGPQPEVGAVSAPSKQTSSLDRCVPQLVSEQARRDPRRIALSDGSTHLTYAELEHRANRLAHRLKALDADSNAVVAVCMHRSPLAPLASLAIMKAGAAYLPLDPNYPHERLSFILTDASARLVLTDSSVVDRLPEGSWRIILADCEHAVEAPAVDLGHASPNDLSYVIYTSGSTGTPKGVEITHRNLLNLVFWHQKTFAVTEDDRAAQFASFGFDAAVWELWPYLTAGAEVRFTPEDVRSSPELLRDWLVDHEIAIAFVPTVLAEQLITLDWPLHTRLRSLLAGADTLHHYPRPGLPFALINNYGPTEATVVTTSGRVMPRERNHEQRPPIGRTIDGAEVYIVDESLNPVPRGEAGELCIGGAGVGRGYVNSPELTAKKFVADPFTNKLGSRLFRTGDRCRWLPDGQIEYISRLDDLVKIRGHRVEPNEIVAALDMHPAVKASAVMARQDDTDELHLVAYLVMNEAEKRPTTAQLCDALLRRLPAYMVPAVFVVLPDLPLTLNGKIDREALPRPDEGNCLPDEGSLSPRTLLEEKLSALVTHLLGVTHVGVDQNLFLVGGHSLFGTQLIARIRDNFGVDLPLRSVFESPTLALLAQEIERAIATRIDMMSEDEVQFALKHALPGEVQK